MPAITLIAGSFHKDKVQRMVHEASSTATALKLDIKSVLWVPGSFEMPLALQHSLYDTAVDAVALLGIIERGETKHGLVMAQSVFPAVLQLQLETKKPVGIGVIGPEVLDAQIEPRLLPHARAAVEAIHTMLQILHS